MSNTAALARSAAASLVLLLNLQPASAAVSTAGDSAELIAAINAANAAPDIDVIELTDDIVLTAIDNVGNGPNGLPTITTPIVLLGNGHSISRDPAAPSFRLFEVLGDFFGDGRLTLDGVRLAGGDVAAGAGGPPANPCFADLSVCGGAVLSLRGDVTLRLDVLLEENQAYEGGGIFTAAGPLTISDSTVSNNRALRGGGIASAFFPGDLITIERTNFENNEADESGGGIYNRTGLSITDSTFDGNRAANGIRPFDGGGALYNTSAAGQADVTTSLFTNNEARNGGAIANFNAADVTVRNSGVIANRTVGFGNGGGIFNEGSGAAVTMIDSRVNDNETLTTFGDGGGIYSGEGGRLTLENTQLLRNVAFTDGGGAVALQGRIANSQVDDNRAENGDGGGIYHEGLGALEIVASSISNNFARREGGALATFSPFSIVPDGITIDDSTISGNTAEDGGGVANTERGVITIRRTLIADNSATGLGLGGFGGGILSNSSGQTAVTNSTIVNNAAAVGGGGIYNSNFSVMTIGHSTITGNTASSQGGGIGAVAPLVLSDSIVANNTGGGGTPNCFTFSSITDGGGNFTNDLGAAFPCPATFTETASLNLDVLADNGGPTRTVALLAGSAAIDGGVSCTTPTDQRGVPRPVACDAGAYEGDVVVPLLSFETAASTIAESPGGPVDVFVELDNSAGTLTDGEVTAFVTLDGLAAGGGRDYALTIGPPILFGANNWPPPGESARQAVQLDVIPDFVLEGEETVRLSLRTGGFAGPATLAGVQEHVVTIADALADLAIGKEVDATETVYPGTDVTFTITVTNNGPTDAADVSVYDVLPATALDLSAATVAATAGTFDPATGDWSLDGTLQGNGFELGAGETETLTVTAEVVATTAGTVSNTAELSRAFPPLAADPDARNDSATASFDVCDAMPPDLTVELSPNVLWPPNHKYVQVTATVIAEDESGIAPAVTLLSVTSNEPDNGLGDGDTADDILIGGTTSFDLRAERSGLGDGRIYTATYQATDVCGNTTVESAVVTVPKAQGERP